LKYLYGYLKEENEQLNLCYIVLYKDNEVGWACGTHGGGGEMFVYRLLFGRPEGKRPLGRPRLRWERNITMNLREEANWIRLGQDRIQWRVFVNTVMKVCVP
jgi:hypothetical protein